VIVAVHDAVVVGGGPAGLAAAIALRRLGLSVAVLEREPRERDRIGETVPADLRPTLDALGVWPAFRAQRHLPSRGSASAWGTARLRRTDAMCSPLGAGWHLDRRDFEAMLAAKAVGAGAEVRRAAAAVAIEPPVAGVRRVRANGAPALQGRVVVDATGRSATVAQWLGARRVVHDRLVCAFAVFAAAEPAAAEGRTLVETAEDGWWYATPLPGGRALAALFSDAPTLRVRSCRDPAAWRDALARTSYVHDYLGRPEVPPAVRLAAVTPHRLDRSAGEDWIAIGDAASSLDPLASAGITLALRDGVQAADAIARHLAGDRTALGAHARTIQRRFARHLVERSPLYDLAHRWPASTFWRQRTLIPTDGSPGD
jgi:flavin-dependent dehydrogenase